MLIDSRPQTYYIIKVVKTIVVRKSLDEILVSVQVRLAAPSVFITEN